MNSINAKLLFPTGLIIILACAWIFTQPAIGQNPDSSKTPPAPVSVAAAIKQDVPQQIKAVGTVLPYQTVTIKSRIDSQIMEVKFHDGDEVKKGDVLFLLDDRALKAQLDQAYADLARDQAQIDTLQRQYERNQGLIEQKAISEKLLDDSKAALDAQNAIVAADKSALENIQVQLGYTEIKAPIDGRTGTINITVGNNVKANDTAPLVTINQIQPILIQASLPQDDFDSVRKATNSGDVAAAATRDASDEIAQGTLEYIDNAIDQGTGTFAVRAVFPNKDEHLWPGMLAALVIAVGEDKQALVIPEVAVQSNTSDNFVFVVANGKAQKRAVKIARIQSGMAVIASGLKENEQVAIDGIMALTDGTPVSVSSSQNPAEDIQSGQP